MSEHSGSSAQEDRREAHRDFDRIEGRSAAGLPWLGRFVRCRKGWDKQLARRSAATTRPPRPLCGIYQTEVELQAQGRPSAEAVTTRSLVFNWICRPRPVQKCCRAELRAETEIVGTLRRG